MAGCAVIWNVGRPLNAAGHFLFAIETRVAGKRFRYCKRTSAAEAGIDFRAKRPG
jgi:hypothetical protein